MAIIPSVTRITTVSSHRTVPAARPNSTPMSTLSAATEA